jgi:hyperosmotically inducible periplasmic protein
MRSLWQGFGSLLAVAVLSMGMAAQTSSASRYDAGIQAKAVHELASKSQFKNLNASVEDCIITLTGSVDIYQQKLDAANKVHKIEHVDGVRNLIAVEGKNVSDADLVSQLDRKLYYDRIGYANQFNYVTASVKDGVATLSGEARTDVDRDSALSLANFMPGVKEVVNDIRVAPTSSFDDDIRIRAMRAIYNDSQLGRYASDPTQPIRIVVNNGKLSLYGTVESTMDKDIAGIKANQVFGVFSVQNNLEVVKGS